MNAHDIASKAAELVAGDRSKQHGAKADNFNNIAALWNAYLSTRREPATPLTALDHAHMMVLLKIARTQLGEVNADDYIDGAGYMACAGEIALADNLSIDRKPLRYWKNRDELAQDVFKDRVCRICGKLAWECQGIARESVK